MTAAPAPRAAPWLSNHAALAAVLGAALAVRVAIILVMGEGDHFGDTPQYDAAARSILAGGGPGRDFPRPPVYPGLVALGYLIGGAGNFLAVRMIQLGFGVGVVALTFVLGRAVGGPGLGLLAAGLAAVSPTLAFTTAMIYPEVVYTFLLLLMTLMWHALGGGGGVGRATAVGLTTGVGWLTSQVVVVPAAALAAWFVVRRSGRRRLLAVAGLAALLVVTPWLLYQKAAYGRAGFHLQKADYVMNIARADTALYGARSIPSTVTLIDSAQVMSGEAAGSATGLLRRELGWFLARPGGYLWDYTREFLHFFQPLPDRVTSRNRFNRPIVKWIGAIHFAPLLLFAIAGVLFGRASRTDRVLLTIVPLATAALYAFFFTQARYRIPVEPHMTVLAAMGLVAAWTRVRAPSHRS
jgi:4-amino-4-deoxy-L-arabinose transferase-like glycosyltransferase